MSCHYRCGMQIRSLGFRTDLMVRTAKGGRVEERGGYLTLRSPHCPDFWWGNFLLASRLAAGTGPDWLARFAAQFPHAAHVAIGVDAVDSSELDAETLIGLGLTVERSAVLTATSLRPPRHVNGEAVIRALTSDDDWHQAAALFAAVKADSPAADPMFVAARIAARRAAAAAGIATWFGAFIDDSLLADLGVYTAAADGLARYQDVGTHPSARRRGLAGTLVWRVGHQLLADADIRQLVIVADPDDVAIGIYESIGFVVRESQFSFQREPD